MRFWNVATLVVLLGNPVSGADAPIDFVRDGKPVLIAEQKGDWKQVDGYLQATSTRARLRPARASAAVTFASRFD